ncbi:MAG TPA: hypothetical protein VIW07_12980, partial [Candidatus Udaeobacter sp.]
GLVCSDAGCSDLTSTSSRPALLRLVAHASAKLDTKINAAAIILAIQIATRANLPVFLFLTPEFI